MGVEILIYEKHKQYTELQQYVSGSAGAQTKVSSYEFELMFKHLTEKNLTELLKKGTLPKFCLVSSICVGKGNLW
jgi:hypothetical protein